MTALSCHHRDSAHENTNRIHIAVSCISPALEEISDELHHQYSMGYYPENKNWDGKFRKIQISPGGKGYKLYARKGYYANPPAGDVAATH
jgi:hypothetical protein